jgi:SM-20-related protein
MSLIDHEKLRAAPVMTEPFQHLVAPGLVGGQALQSVLRDFPKMERPGSVPLTALEYGAAFGELVEDLRGPEVTEMLSDKFEIDLRKRPTMVTVRGKCRARDGQIHTDSKDKVVTVLLYLNPSWEKEGGRLRLLRQPDDIEDYIAEVPPDEGTLLAFKCSETAWHGHKSFEGERRAIQLNWVTEERYVRREQRRHKISSFFKRMGLAT